MSVAVLFSSETNLPSGRSEVRRFQFLRVFGRQLRTITLLVSSLVFFLCTFLVRTARFSHIRKLTSTPILFRNQNTWLPPSCSTIFLYRILRAVVLFFTIFYQLSVSSSLRNGHHENQDNPGKTLFRWLVPMIRVQVRGILLLYFCQGRERYPARPLACCFVDIDSVSSVGRRTQRSCHVTLSAYSNYVRVYTRNATHRWSLYEYRLVFFLYWL